MTDQTSLPPLVSASVPAAALAAPDGTLFSHPDRVRPKMRPLKAFGHFRKLIKDKEDTSQVFHIFESLPSRDFVPMARELSLSEQGEYLRATEPYLPDVLDDHAALRQLPKGTVAHAYCDFMEREGLSAAGLVEEHNRFFGDRPKYGDLIEWYASRRRDTHDLLHVLTGFGRDALGEQCVLAFTHGQNGGLGNLFIAYLGALHIARTAPKTLGVKAPVIKAVRQAQKLGKGAPRVTDIAIRDLLAMPLDEAKAMLKIPTGPTVYEDCHRIWRENGIDPYNMITDKQAVAA